MPNEKEIHHKLMGWQLKDEFWMLRAEISPLLMNKQKEELRKALKNSEDYWEMSSVEKRHFRSELASIDNCMNKRCFPLHVTVRFCSAIQGKGLYAVEDISIGCLIGLYAGTVVADDDTVEGNRYLFGIGEGFSIDAASCGNYTRAINNTSPRYANADAYKIKLAGEKAAQIAFIAKKKIKKGQQILFSYGSQYFRALKIKPLPLTPDTV